MGLGVLLGALLICAVAGIGLQIAKLEKQANADADKELVPKLLAVFS